MTGRYDVAIIGAGFSGLAAGVRLAHFGRRVIILERHSVWGGLNSFYKKGGHHFDTGLHAVTNYAQAGKRGPVRLPLKTICRQLRIDLAELALEPQTYSQIVFGDARLRFSNDLELLESEIRETFPRAIDGFRRLREACASYPDLSRDAPRTSGRAAIRDLVGDPLLAEMLLAPVLWYGSAEEGDIDFEQLQILFKSIYEEGFARPRRGVRQLLDLLVKRYAELGGEMRRNAGVARIEVAGGRARELVLENGDVIEAGVVISSAGLVETMKLRSDLPEGTGAADAGRLGFVETIWVLDAPPKSLGHDACCTFFNAKAEMRWAPPVEPATVDLTSGVICCPSNYAHAEPLEEHLVRATHLARPAFWLGAEEARYAAEKAAFTADSLRVISRYVGEVAPRVTYTDAFTPRTVKQYTSKENGAIYGSPRKLKTGRTDLDNLFLCGTDQGLAGIVGAMLSGINMANTHALMKGAE